MRKETRIPQQTDLYGCVSVKKTTAWGGSVACNVTRPFTILTRLYVSAGRQRAAYLSSSAR